MCNSNADIHNQELTEVCSHENEQHLCNQCGKIHTKFFIENHHCLLEVFSSYQENLEEQYSIYHFQSRDPPLSNLFI